MSIDDDEDIALMKDDVDDKDAKSEEEFLTVTIEGAKETFQLKKECAQYCGYIREMLVGDTAATEVNLKARAGSVFGVRTCIGFLNNFSKDFEPMFPMRKGKHIRSFDLRFAYYDYNERSGPMDEVCSWCLDVFDKLRMQEFKEVFLAAHYLDIQTFQHLCGVFSAIMVKSYPQDFELFIENVPCNTRKVPK